MLRRLFNFFTFKIILLSSDVINYDKYDYYNQLRTETIEY